MHVLFLSKVIGNLWLFLRLQIVEEQCFLEVIKCFVINEIFMTMELTETNLIRVLEFRSPESVQKSN